MPNQQERPYFMENKEWFYFDQETWKYKLTDKATKQARESYVQFYNEGDVVVEEVS